MISDRKEKAMRYYVVRTDRQELFIVESEAIAEYHGGGLILQPTATFPSGRWDFCQQITAEEADRLVALEHYTRMACLVEE